MASLTHAPEDLEGDSSTAPDHRVGRWRRWIDPSSAFQALGPLLTSLAALAGVVVMWWLCTVFVIEDPVLLPTPEAVFHRLVAMVAGEPGVTPLWPNIVSSVKRVLVGWGLACVAGIGVGIAMASNRHIRALIDPLIELGRPIPPLAFAPLLVVWFGIGELPKVVILFFAAFPPVVIATVAAILSVDESWKRAALTLGASRTHLMSHVVLRAALPEIIVGMRIASGMAWSTLIAAEIIASTSGLGYMILFASRYLETETIFVGIIIIGLLAFLLDLSLRVLGRWLAPWKGKG